MKKEEYELCEKQIKKFYCCEKQSEKEAIRNNLFHTMKPDINKWIYSVLKSKNLYMEDDEITSLSWDCFIFSLKHYNPKKNIPLINHFFSYTKFYLFTINSKNLKNKNRSLILKSNDFIQEETIGNIEALSSMEELKNFRDLLSKDLIPIFDDALMSMRSATADRQRKLHSTSLNYSQYRNSKKIFKIIIDFLLRR